jgi:predicted transcriptional regulator
MWTGDAIIVGSKITRESNRDKYAIWSTMLQSCTVRRLTRTNIMYIAMMNMEQCKVYLKELMTAKLIKIIDGGDNRSDGRYETTPKGADFIDTYRELTKMVPDVKT